MYNTTKCHLHPAVRPNLKDNKINPETSTPLHPPSRLTIHQEKDQRRKVLLRTTLSNFTLFKQHFKMWKKRFRSLDVYKVYTYWNSYGKYILSKIFILLFRLVRLVVVKVTRLLFWNVETCLRGSK